MSKKITPPSLLDDGVVAGFRPMVDVMAYVNTVQCYYFRMVPARPKGFEPLTFCSVDRRSTMVLAQEPHEYAVYVQS